MVNYLDSLKTNVNEGASLDALMVDIDLIDTKEQVRTVFKGIETFAESILDAGKIFQPLVVVRNGRRFTVHQGERRLRAAKYLVSKGHSQFQRVPVTFAEFKSDVDSFKAQLAENSARQDLTTLDWVSSIIKYRDNFDNKTGWKGRLAKAVDKDPAFVSLHLKIDALPDDIKQLAADDVLTTPRRLIELDSFSNKDELIKMLRKGESYPKVVAKGKPKAKAKAKKNVKAKSSNSLSKADLNTLAGFLVENGHIDEPTVEKLVHFVKSLDSGKNP